MIFYDNPSEWPRDVSRHLMELYESTKEEVSERISETGCKVSFEFLWEVAEHVVERECEYDPNEFDFRNQILVYLVSDFGLFPMCGGRPSLYVRLAEQEVEERRRARQARLRARQEALRAQQETHSTIRDESRDEEGPRPM